MTHGGPSEGRRKTWIAGDGLLEQVERLSPLGFTRPREIRQGAQIDIICGEIVGGSLARSADLGRLQRRLDDPGDADGNLVLKFENVLQGAVEPVGP